MIVAHYVEDGARIRHYSDQGMWIRQVETGILYQDAVDVLPCAYTYEETDIPILYEMDPQDVVSMLFGGGEE